MVVTRFILLFCAFFMLPVAEAQQMVFVNVSEQLGLPSLECYSIIEDQKGYVWVSTEAALYRYNGDKLVPIADRKAVPRETAYYMTVGEDSALWICTSKNRILRYAGDSLYELPVSAAYARLLVSPLNTPYKLSFHKHYLYVHSNWLTVALNLLSGKGRRLRGNPAYALNLFYTGKDMIPADRGEIFLPGDTALIRVYTEDTDTVYSIRHRKGTSYHRVTMCRAGGYHFVSFDDKLLRFDARMHLSVFQLPARILCLYGDPSGGLWAGVYQNGLYYYKDPGKMKSVQSLERYSVAGIVEDREKNVWCSTLENGIFVCRNKRITAYAGIPGLDHPADMLVHREGSIFVASSESGLLRIVADSVHFLNIGKGSLLTDIIRSKDKDNWFIAGGKELITLDSGFSYLRRSRPFNSTIHYSFVAVPGDSITLYYANAVSTLKGASVVNHQFPSGIMIRQLLFIGGNRFLLGSNDGLYTADFSLPGIKRVNGPFAYITRLIPFSGGGVMVASKSGLFLLRDGRVTDIGKLLHLPSDTYFDAAEDKRGRIWLASNRGLVLISRTADGYGWKNYTVAHGLLSNTVYKLAIDSQNVFLSTSGGLCAFPLDEDLSNAAVPPVYLSGIWAGDQPVNAGSGDMRFPHGRNSLRLAFDAISFKSNRPDLAYSLNGKKYMSNAGNEILLENLLPGHYILKVSAISSDGVFSNQPVVLVFTVMKPFWKTYGFIGGCGLMAALLLYAVFRASVNVIRRREAEKSRIHALISESRLEALQAQMNPHFIFNSINSIQNYILKQKEEEAYSYLSKFSRLIRMVLTNSQDKLLPLIRELETISLYIELEQLRFGNRFDFRLRIDPEIDQHATCIPTMLIQPFIENAIWHGLMNLEPEKRGMLRLSLSMAENGMLISVEDNGVGRERSAAYRRNVQHRPAGILLTEQRLKVIAALQGYEKTSVNIVDLYDHLGIASGTRVDIWVPSDL